MKVWSSGNFGHSILIWTNEKIENVDAKNNSYKSHCTEIETICEYCRVILQNNVWKSPFDRWNHRGLLRVFPFFNSDIIFFFNGLWSDSLALSISNSEKEKKKKNGFVNMHTKLFLFLSFMFALLHFFLDCTRARSRTWLKAYHKRTPLFVYTISTRALSVASKIYMKRLK